MVWPELVRRGQGRVGIAMLGPISQPEMKPVSQSLFLGISGDGPGAVAASSLPGGTGTLQTKFSK